MDIPKDNVKVTVKSKIPLPAKPQSAFSQNVLKKLKPELEMERHPLKNINRQPTDTENIAGTSTNFEKVISKTKCPIRIDTRYVTIRQKSEDLDWDYKVFKDDNVKESSIVVISDDDETNKETKSRENRYFIENHEKNCLEEIRKAVTPVVKSQTLEPNQVRNIKRSLKRPHSRELQGLSPRAKHERRDERHKRKLIFSEHLKANLHSPDCIQKSYMTCLDRDYTADLFNYLLNMEKKTAIPNIASTTRACVMNWLMKINGPNGNPAVVQSARWYLDSILASCHVHLDKLQLVAAACYWISQKIHGQVVTARRLVQWSSQAFSTERLLITEKMVLFKLKFPTQPVLPQEFITYLSWWCDNVHPGEIEVAATFICIAGLMVDKVLCNEWPSVIGAAAVRNAVLLLRKKEAITKLQRNPVFQEVLKKTLNISYVCSIQRKAVRLLSSPIYEYKAPLEYYGIPPFYIAQKIISSANELALIDNRRQM